MCGNVNSKEHCRCKPENPACLCGTTIISHAGFELCIYRIGIWHLQASFDAAMAQKQALEDDATATQRKMDSANALLSALAGEEGRWTQQSKEFDDTIQKLTGERQPLYPPSGSVIPVGET